MESSWRPPGWEGWNIYDPAVSHDYEAGASAIIPYVEAETARKYEKRIKELQETCAQWERLVAEVKEAEEKRLADSLFELRIAVKAQARREVGELMLKMSTLKEFHTLGIHLREGQV